MTRTDVSTRRALLATALAAALMAMTLVATPAVASSPSPLADGGWHLVAHMSDSGGMFDGNTDLASGAAFGTFVANPSASTADFQRSFTDAVEILFITGDGSVWAMTDYAALRARIDARDSNLFGTNLTFTVGVNGVVTTNQGNVLSRPGSVEDPWISIDGNHFDGIANQRIVWGENDWDAPWATHTALKNLHGGINVYVRGPMPANADDCKGGGWNSFVDDALTSFKNQGDCVSFIATGGSNPANG